MSLNSGYNRKVYKWFSIILSMEDHDSREDLGYVKRDPKIDRGIAAILRGERPRPLHEKVISPDCDLDKIRGIASIRRQYNPLNVNTKGAILRDLIDLRRAGANISGYSHLSKEELKRFYVETIEILREELGEL